MAERLAFINCTRGRKLPGEGGFSLDDSLAQKGGIPRDPAAVRMLLSRALKWAQCLKGRFHDLRHASMATALKCSMEVKTLSGTVGHGSTGFTRSTCSHSSQPDAPDSGYDGECGDMSNGAQTRYCVSALHYLM